MTTLSGCASKHDVIPAIHSTGIARPYPAIPADLATPVALPTLTENQDARAALAENRAALKQCRIEQTDLVGWYRRLRKTKG